MIDEGYIMKWPLSWNSQGDHDRTNQLKDYDTYKTGHNKWNSVLRPCLLLHSCKDGIIFVGRKEVYDKNFLLVCTYLYHKIAMGSATKYLLSPYYP